jgi:DNA-dependent RNA polymerase auxiliary subunit epsilon
MRTSFAPRSCRLTSSTLLRHFVGSSPSEICLRSYATARFGGNNVSTKFLRPSAALPVGRSLTDERRYASGGGFMQRFFKRKRKAPRRDETTSSRYLDATPEEDAILGRSLRQKSNDDYLRCTEFDREGGSSDFFCGAKWRKFLTTGFFLQEMSRSYPESSRRRNYARRLVSLGRILLAQLSADRLLHSTDCSPETSERSGSPAQLFRTFLSARTQSW